MSKRVLSGITPSGEISLGNYFGAIQLHLELPKENDCFYFIANYHALTTVRDKARLEDLTKQVARTYIALGLDTTRAALYRQSDLPEVCELAWYLASVTGMGLMDRAHSYKDKVANGITPTVGLYTYPILMAADILITGASLVPVGADQVQHLEMARDMAGYFNNTYQKEVLTLPEPLLSNTPKVPGIDGRKMSKSYDNTIQLFAPLKKSRKRIMGIVTDSTPMEDPKNPENCNVLNLLKLFTDEKEIKTWETRYKTPPLGYGEVKQRLYECFESKFAPARERWEKITDDEVEAILSDGVQRVRKIADPLMDRVRSACGILTKNRG